MSRHFSILASASVAFDRSFMNKDIRNMVKDETGLSVRRQDNFTLAAMNAVYRLLNKNPLVSKCVGLYSSGEYFSLELLQSTIVSQFNGEPIRPLDFIATVGNAANFYLAKEFTLTGPNNFIGASQNALEKCVLLARSDLSRGLIEEAVVVVWTEELHRRCCTAYLLRCSSQLANKVIDSSNLDRLSDADENFPVTINWGI